MSKKDPFAFDDPVQVKREYTNEEIKQFEQMELKPFFCKEGDADFLSHVSYLQSLVDDAIKAQLTKRPLKILATAQTVDQILKLVAGMPQRPHVAPPKFTDKTKPETKEKKTGEYQSKLQAVKDKYKEDLQAWRASLKPHIEKIAKGNVVGTLCSRGRERFLFSKKVIVIYADGTTVIAAGKTQEYAQLQAKLEAYEGLQGRRRYARKMELQEQQASLAQSKKVVHD